MKEKIYRAWRIVLSSRLLSCPTVASEGQISGRQDAALPNAQDCMCYEKFCDKLPA